MSYQQRIIDTELDALMPHLAAISIEGMKGVGKTETASQRASTIFNLDDDNQRSIVTADPQIMNKSEQPVFIDEWQRHPAIWDVVRRAVDSDRRPSQFLLAGSASPAAGSQIHSGAGRIVSLRMRPMSLLERGTHTPTIALGDLLTGDLPPISGASPVDLRQYVHEIIRSGLPGIYDLPPIARRAQLDGYMQRVIDHELPMLGAGARRPQTLRQLLAAYAAATATTTSYQQIMLAATPGDGAQPAKTTLLGYRDALLRLWLLDPIAGWTASRSPLTRIRQSPKHHLADPALAAQLLGATSETLLGGQGGRLGGDGALLGALFESLVALNIQVYAQANHARVYHLRTRDDRHEVDLIVERPDGAIVAIEVKLASAINAADGTHLRWLAAQIGPRLLDSVIINTGDTAYRRQDGIAVIPLALLGP